MIGPETEKAIKLVLQFSDFAWTGFADGEIACMWGLQPQTALSNVASLWMISTPVVEKYAFLFLRWSQIFIDDLKRNGRYTTINGKVRKDFTRSVRWLKWLGFQVKAPDKDGNMYFYWSKPL